MKEILGAIPFLRGIHPKVRRLLLLVCLSVYPIIHKEVPIIDREMPIQCREEWL